jgi:lysophospholipase L1-like esterase
VGFFDFLRFSPLWLRFHLWSGWTLLSLSLNVVLVAVLLLLGLRNDPVALPSDAAVPPNGVEVSEVSSSSAQANLAVLSSPGGRPPARRHHLNYQQWQDLLAQEAEVAAAQKPDRLSVLAGDSISLWFPTELLPPKRSWLNQGISGEKSQGLLKRLNLLDKTEPEAIFIMIGINDLLHGTPDESILDSQREIVRYLQTAHPHSQIIIQSILPHAAQEEATWEGRERFADLPNSRIKALNRALETIAREQGVYFLDLYPVFANSQDNLRMDLSTDGLHLNARGYETWSIALQVYSREVLEPELAINE